MYIYTLHLFYNCILSVIHLCEYLFQTATDMYTIIREIFMILRCFYSSIN